MTTMLEKAARAVGEVAANMHEDVHHVLSPAAIERVTRAVLMAVREPDEAEKMGAFWLAEFQTPGSDVHLRAVAGNTFTAMIDAILNEGEG